MKRVALLAALLAGAVAASAAASTLGSPGAGQRTDPTPAAPGAPAAVAALDRRIADIDAEELSAKQELAGLGGHIKAAHERVLRNGRAFYRLTRAGMLPLGGGFDALVTHAMNVERARRALGGDLAAERRLRERGAELAGTLARVDKDRVALASQRSAMDAARVVMEEESRRQAAFDRAFSTSTGKAGGSREYIAVYGGNGSAPEVERGSGFASAKGRLLLPLVGKAEIRPAKKEGGATPGGTDGAPGLELRTTLGAPVRAVYAGRVAFADRYGPYGRIVIIDHGDHYYSVSGNLASVDVKVGDELSAAERIGTVGDDGQGPKLYFEIRHGAQTVNPSPWLGL